MLLLPLVLRSTRTSTRYGTCCTATKTSRKLPERTLKLDVAVQGTRQVVSALLLDRNSREDNFDS